MKTASVLPLAVSSPPPSAISGPPAPYTRWSRMLSRMANNEDSGAPERPLWRNEFGRFEDRFWPGAAGRRPIATDLGSTTGLDPPCGQSGMSAFGKGAPPSFRQVHLARQRCVARVAAQLIEHRMSVKTEYELSITQFISRLHPLKSLVRLAPVGVSQRDGV